MAKRTARAVEVKLLRELKHRAWLRQHLPKSTQLRDCERQILLLRTVLAEQRGIAVAQ